MMGENKSALGRATNARSAAASSSATPRKARSTMNGNCKLSYRTISSARPLRNSCLARNDTIPAAICLPPCSEGSMALTKSASSPQTMRRSIEQEAIYRYGRVHGLAEQTLAEAKRRLAEARGQHPPRIETPLDRFAKTREAIKAFGFDPDPPVSEAEWFARSAAAERLTAGRAVDAETGHPIDVAPAETAPIAALHSGLGPAPLPTLEDAKSLYLADRSKRSSSSELARKKDEQRAGRVVVT